MNHGPRLLLRIACALAATVLIGASVHTLPPNASYFHAGERFVQKISDRLDGRNVAAYGNVSVVNVRFLSVTASSAMLLAQASVNGSARATSPLSRIDLRTLRCYDSGGADISATVSSMYSPATWGELPAAVTGGSTWSLSTPAHGYFPPGHASVRVARIDAISDSLTLTEHGLGDGPSANDLAHPGDLLATIHNAVASYTVHETIGRTTWSGTMLLRRGLVVREAIVVHTNIFMPKTPISQEYTWVRTYDLTSVQQSASYGD